MKHVIVTGATGLVGRHVVRRLHADGHHVAALVRDVDAARRSVPEASEYHRFSSSMPDGSWTEALDRADAIIHLAGAPVAKRWNDAQKRLIRTSRIDSTHNIVAALARAEHRPRVLISASGIGYYGTSPDAAFTESSAHGGDLLATVCAEWEKEAQAATAHGARVVVLRLGVILDRHDGALARLVPAFRFFVGGPVAPGTQWFPWVHIDDVVEMVAWAMANDHVEGPLNAVAPGIVTNGAFSRILGRVLGRPSIFKVPQFVVRIILGDGAYILTEGQHAVPERVLNLGFRFGHSELEPALRSLLGGS